MLTTGIQGKNEITVTENLLANQVGSGLVAVYATPKIGRAHV